MAKTKLNHQDSTKSKKSSALWIFGVVTALIAMIGLGVYAGYSTLVGPGVDPKALEVSNQPIDQLSPIPSSGQADMIGRYCDIITPPIAKELGSVGSPIEVKGPIGACDVALNDNALIQISSVGPYGRLSPSDNPHFAQAITIAGLEARLYNLSAPLSGECTVKLNTRSITTPTINVRWNITNDFERATKRAKSCEIAQKAADVLAKAYVPLAGGTIYEGTLQKPLAKSIENYPCRIVTNAAALAGEVYDIQDDRNKKQDERRNQANQCTYEYGGNKAVVTLDMSSPGIDRFPVPGSEKNVSRKMGPLPVRESQKDNTCSVTVELVPGTALNITYTSTDTASSPCAMAEIMQATSIKMLVDTSSLIK